MISVKETSKLSGRYAKLAKDLAAAAEVGIAAGASENDGGTCNCDAVTLYLRGWREKNVEAAATAAGVGCFRWMCGSDRLYVFTLMGCFQGNARTTAAEAMRDYLESAGYSASVYSAMD